jgi:hypothetical protein
MSARLRVKRSLKADSSLPSRNINNFLFKEHNTALRKEMIDVGKINLTLLSLVLLGTLMGLIAGCYTNPITLRTNEPEDYFKTYHVSVTSEPSDADVYINNVLSGRTPCIGLPITVKLRQVYATFDYCYEIKEQIYIRVVKEGYKDSVMAVEMDPKGYRTGSALLKKTDYHFVLEKE